MLRGNFVRIPLRKGCRRYEIGGLTLAACLAFTERFVEQYAGRDRNIETVDNSKHGKSDGLNRRTGPNGGKSFCFTA